MAEAPKSEGGSSSELQWFFGVLGGLFVLWTLTGGPERKSSQDVFVTVRDNAVEERLAEDPLYRDRYLNEARIRQIYEEIERLEAEAQQLQAAIGNW